jgi:hypothetical protein
MTVSLMSLGTNPPEVPLLYWAVEVETFFRVLLTLAILFNNLFNLFTRILNAPRLGY